MDPGRRTFIRDVGSSSVIALLASYGLLPESAYAELWNKAAFEATSLEEALVNVLDGARVADNRGDRNGVGIIAPEIAENGAIVPVGVVAAVPDIESIAILCEDNPQPLAAIYDIPPGGLPEIRTRVKMAASSNVVVLVKAAGVFHMASKAIKVTRGGCG
ncbi:MAG: thiosulfate oxidation carrier protein SoxY [Betaproteobacteria bacterium]|nr:MAG: thiosulfate oxidation carrier protein SoxY [Betaproteobacteria bacterium]